MQSRGAGEQLGSMHPTMSTATRIGVVGGGPSGLSAAWALVKLGYENVTVLEQNSKVGGMCGSELVEGRVYDMGGQVIAKESSPTLVALMSELGVELEEMGAHTMARIDCATMRMDEIKIVADCVALLPVTSKLQVQAGTTGKLGVHAVSSVAHELAPQYLQSKGLAKGVPSAIAALFTASGYGYPQDMPYAYVHEFVRSSLGQAWRVKGGYSSFWKKVANLLPDVRCNVQVKRIQRREGMISVFVVESSNAGLGEPTEATLEFDKIIISGSASIPRGSARIYRSLNPSISGIGNSAGMLDYTKEEMDLFSKVETIDYYTTVLKISGLGDIPAMFYYPEHADDPSNNIGRFVAMQRFYAKTDIFLFWSYGTAEVDQEKVLQLLYEDVQRMGGRVESLILQRKWCYFPHVSSPDMAMGFYDMLDELQGKNNTFYTGALSAFELTERNAAFSIDLVGRCFGSSVKPLSVKRLLDYPLPNGATGQENFRPRELVELPGLQFPNLATTDAYLSFYGNHPVTKDRVVYTWLDNNGKESHKLTFSELDARASTIAHHLLTSNSHSLKPGDRVVLLHPPGLEFIEAFLGCLRARILAVPLIPPDPTNTAGDQALEKLANVVKITDAKAILSTRAYHSVCRASSISLLKKAKIQWPNLPWIHTNSLPNNPNVGAMASPCTHEQSEPPSHVNDVCFLQFTSGSTGDSKGVMITHGALIHNVKSMRSAYKSTSQSVVVSWLPQYHDMGLIGGLLVSMVTGGSLVIFSPITFIRKPMMWLEAVEKYRATHTAAPNFGFELVLKRYEAMKATHNAHTDGQPRSKRALKKFDLSSLIFLMVGAEPISSQTMRGFVDTFWDAGVREQIFAPGFGMAENCVFICCAFGRNQPMFMDSEGRVCCGYTDHSRGKGVLRGCNPHFKLQSKEESMDACSDVRTVNPDTLEEVDDGVEGEIWLSSPSNGVGYWGMVEATNQTFNFQLSRPAKKEDGEILFVRSGDLGRIIEGKLFVTGRIKDLIIVQGRNYYPSDIEKTVENCSPSIRPGCSAAFSAAAKILKSRGIPVQDSTSQEAGIVVVAEVRDETNLDEDDLNLLTSKIKEVVAVEHGVQVAFVNLIKPRTIPKTTSGKIRRRECLKRFSEESLSSVKSAANVGVTRAQARLQRLLRPQATYRQIPSADKKSKPMMKSKEDISKFLVQLVSEITGMAASRIDVLESFENYSIDSQGTVAAASRLSEFLETHISAIQIYTTGCISELAEFCDDLVRKTSSSNAGSSDNISGAKVSGAESNQPMMNERFEFQDNANAITRVQLVAALEPSQKRQIVITMLQGLGILYIAALLIMPAVYIYEKLMHIIIPVDKSISVQRLIFLTTGLVPLGWILYIATTGVVLSTLGARTLMTMNKSSSTTAIPLWSLSYVRWWTLYRLQDFASSTLAQHLRGTIFLTYWYRLLGADIDEDVCLDTVDITDPALLSIGSGAVLGEGATIQSHEVNAGIVIFQSVKIGKGCIVGPYSVVQRGTTMDAGSSIGALSKTNVGEFVSTGLAQPAPRAKSNATQTFLLAIWQLCGLYLVALTSTLSALAAYTTFMWLASGTEIVTENSLGKIIAMEYAKYGFLLVPLVMTFPKYLVILAPLMMFPEPSVLVELLVYMAKEPKVALLLSTCGAAYLAYGATLGFLTCVLKWTLIGRAKEGSLDGSKHSQGLRYRTWLVHALLRSAHEKFMGMLMGTETLCIYLRCLGSKVGRLASIRRLNALVDPDMLNLGDESHLGDFAKIITSQNFPGGSISIGEMKVGDECVVGAQSVVMPGATLQDRSVLGALSVAPPGSILEEGGVYVGAKTLVRIYQQRQAGAGSHGDNLNKEVAAMPGQNQEDEDHPLVVGMANLDLRFRQMIASVAAEFVKKTPVGHSRYIHYLGCSGKGTLRVLDNLPKGLPNHDILAPGATYPVILRCSNGVSKDDDRCAEVRGGTLRLLQTDSPDDFHKPLLDLFMKTGSIFHARNMVEFLGYYIMTEEERDQKIKQFPALGESQWQNLREPNSYAELHYYCCTTRLFKTFPKSTDCATAENPRDTQSESKHKGEDFYVKFKIRPLDPRFGEDEGEVKPTEGLPPLSGKLPPSPDDTRSKSYLRDDFKSRLNSAEGVKFILQLQLHPIPDSAKEREKVQDPTKVWDENSYPYMDVAEIWLNEHLEDTLFDDIHFNPKHGPQSLAMITATSAMQAASVDQGRSIMHDLLGYLRSGSPLPPMWNDLVKKSYTDVLPPAGQEEKQRMNAVAPGCPMMMGSQDPSHEPLSRGLSVDGEQRITDNAEKHDKSRKNTYVLNSKIKSLSASDVLQIRDLTFLRFIQPILQAVAPMALLTLAVYPTLLSLAAVGTIAGKEWMYRLLPVAYLCTGSLFAVLGVVCKWALSWKIKDGHTHELWSFTTLCHTVWDSINQTLASTFLELTKGSPLCVWYLQSLGASIKQTTVYIDTLYALNPDQVQIGKRSAIGRNALLFGHLYEGDKVTFKSNFIGDDTVVGSRALVLPGLKMEDGSQLQALELGMKDEVIRADYL